MSFERLAQITGRPKSTMHHYCISSCNSQATAFLCLLEWLPDQERQTFIQKHCRTLPTLAHPALSGRPGQLAKLEDLLHLRQGLTVITGQDWNRRFLVTALGHSFNLRHVSTHACAGIDIHKPLAMVPVTSLFYIDPEAGPRAVRDAVLRLIPKVATASGTLLLFNGIWSAVPEVRPEILRASKRNHVIMAELGTPDVRYIKDLGGPAYNRINLSPSKRVRGRICFSLRAKSSR